MDVGLVTQRTNLDMGSVAQRVDESIRNIGRISTTAYKELQGTDPQYATQFAEVQPQTSPFLSYIASYFH